MLQQMILKESLVTSLLNTLASYTKYTYSFIIFIIITLVNLVLIWLH